MFILFMLYILYLCTACICHCTCRLLVYKYILCVGSFNNKISLFQLPYCEQTLVLCFHSERYSNDGLRVLTRCRISLFCYFKELAASICRVTEVDQSELCTSAMDFWLAKIQTAFSYSWHICSFQSLQHTSEPSLVTLKVNVTSFFEMLEQTYPTQ